MPIPKDRNSVCWIRGGSGSCPKCGLCHHELETGEEYTCENCGKKFTAWPVDPRYNPQPQLEII
ncbi:MAG: hypothetical protein A2751_02955 [Candidatus Doudnabacteria bacterium RIFCSPHIGHO2_01_FULL_46_14]|uniref:Uncharacterized protein n=1 Tax=Candidatus Doudnabacteria bacterium RIFCSPHIGHO2_01_FULL_46_14 TaxID=1817824 RepID=A0A1F5NK02_9BACT|nr:MAG: hypothetical protein A2751_02955 [Candidatus Doudnabacteria bacterium RIFCSPHIGHO2_01_FULL_46_14]